VREAGRVAAAAVRARSGRAGLTAPALDELVDRARALAGAGRRLLGITGAPGAGKSTIAAAVVEGLGPDVARLVPMDGFHYAQRELERLGRADRKGAADTFDAAGFVSLLARLRAADDAVVYAPEFRREIEEPIACALPVPSSVPLIVTEGNYLLVGDGDWARVRPLLDEVWFVETDDTLRQERLIARHVAFGKDPAYARAWSLGTDEHNALLVASTRGLADLVVRLD
jgi:pantothenate kinase